MNVIKTNIPQLDIILGGSGLPLGKVVEVFGEEGVSKSTFSQSLSILFQQQYPEGKVLYIDTERSFDMQRYSYMCGDIDRIEVYQSDIVEDIFKKINEELDKAELNNYKLFIVLDTIASTITKNEATAKFSGGISERPRVLSSIFPPLVRRLDELKATLIIDNQVYSNIGSTSKTTKGGRAIKYYASLRLELKKKAERIVRKNNLEIVEGIYVEIKPKKNKLISIDTPVLVYIHKEKGLDAISSIMRYIEDNKIVSKAGSWKRFQYEDVDFKYQNEDSFLMQLEKNEKALDIIKFLIFEKYIHISPLVKLKLIDDYNEIASKLGKPELTLTEREKQLAELQLKTLEEVEV